MVHLKHPENEFTKFLFTLDIFGSIRSNSDAISFFISILFWSRPKEPNYKCKHSLKFIRHSNALYEAHTKPPVFMEKLHCLEKNWKKELFACYMLLVVSTATDCVCKCFMNECVSCALPVQVHASRWGGGSRLPAPEAQRFLWFPLQWHLQSVHLLERTAPPRGRTDNEHQSLNSSQTRYRLKTKTEHTGISAMIWKSHTKYMCGSGPQKKMLFLSKKSSRVSCDLEYIVSRFVKISSMLDIFYIFQFYLWWSQAFVLKSIC